MRIPTEQEEPRKADTVEGWLLQCGDCAQPV